MSMFEKNSVLHDVKLRTREIKFEVTVVGNATPASKGLASDLPGPCVLRANGLTAAADAIEVVAFTAPVDSLNSIFGVLLQGGRDQMGKIKKVLDVRVVETSTATTSGITVTKHGTNGLSAGGNIAFSITATGATFSAGTTSKFMVEVSYQIINN